MPPPHVLLDEIALAGPEHLDPAYVAGYDRKTGLDPTADLDELKALGLDATGTLIDLGAGTGAFAFAAAARCARVVAVDVSPAMVEMMRGRAASEDVRNVEVVHAGFLSYEHQGPAADVVYTRHALHHLPDFWKALALTRLAALLRPGGLLRLRDLVFSFEPSDAERVIGAWLDGAATRPEDGWTRPELEEHLRSEHSTFSWLLEPMLERAGFEIVRADLRNPIFADYLCRVRRP